MKSFSWANYLFGIQLRCDINVTESRDKKHLANFICLRKFQTNTDVRLQIHKTKIKVNP